MSIARKHLFHNPIGAFRRKADYNNDEKGIDIDNKIYCPECNQEISSNLDTCPECGFPFKATETLNFQTAQEVKMVDISRKKVLAFSCILYALGVLCFSYAFIRLTSLTLIICLIGIALICVGISLQRGSKPKSKASATIVPVTSSSSSIPYYPSSTSASEVRCPKCGSTQIQMITRKWSPLTGFMTNKVDRVCMKCKHRF